MNALNKPGRVPYYKSVYSDALFINVSFLLMVLKELFSPNAKQMMQATNHLDFKSEVIYTESNGQAPRTH